MNTESTAQRKRLIEMADQAKQLSNNLVELAESQTDAQAKGDIYKTASAVLDAWDQAADVVTSKTK